MAVINLYTEELLSYLAASAMLPGNPHISTLHRWATRGVRGVRLETVLVGGRRYTSRRAIADFIERTSSTTAVRPLAPIAGSTRGRQIAAAERRFRQATN